MCFIRFQNKSYIYQILIYIKVKKRNSKDLVFILLFMELILDFIRDLKVGFVVDFLNFTKLYFLIFLLRYYLEKLTIANMLMDFKNLNFNPTPKLILEYKLYQF